MWYGLRVVYAFICFCVRVCVYWYGGACQCVWIVCFSFSVWICAFYVPSICLLSLGSLYASDSFVFDFPVYAFYLLLLLCCSFSVDSFYNLRGVVDTYVSIPASICFDGAYTHTHTPWTTLANWVLWLRQNGNKTCAVSVRNCIVAAKKTVASQNYVWKRIISFACFGCFFPFWYACKTRIHLIFNMDATETNSNSVGCVGDDANFIHAMQSQIYFTNLRNRIESQRFSCIQFHSNACF